MKRIVWIGALLLAGVSMTLAQKPTSPVLSEIEKEASRELPFHKNALTAFGLLEPVEVVRDRYGIPHIYAKNTHDVFFAQGFVAAQDHLWQMEMWRRSNEGRLAEVLGKQYVPRDEFARSIRYSGSWQKELESYGPQGREILEAYAEGVNSAINVAIEQQKIPIEFQLMKFLPSPSWTVQTLLTRVPAWAFTHGAAEQLRRGLVVKSVGPEKAKRLFAGFDLAVLGDVDLSALTPEILANAKGTGASKYSITPAPLKLTAPAGVSSISNPATDASAMLGSNAWVIGGKKSADGKPILAADPHFDVTNPAPLAFVHLSAPGWDVIGLTEPGMPGVIMGHNRDVAWGSAVLPVHQQDIVVEETDPANPDRYRHDGTWMTMEHDRNVIQVLGERGKPRSFTAKRTLNGPVLYEDMTKHRAYVLRWSGAQAGAASFMGSLNVLQAKDWDSFAESMKHGWSLPAQGVVYADVHGDYGLFTAGLIPRHGAGTGALPVAGTNNAYDWKGFLTTADLPRERNGLRGFYAIANNDVFTTYFVKSALTLRGEYAAPYRFDRIEEVLRQNHPFTVKDMAALQSDTISLPAKQLIAMVRGVKSSDAATQSALLMLSQWDGSVRAESAPAALYEAWRMKLMQRVTTMAGGGEVTSQQVLAIVKAAKPNDRESMLLDSLKEAQTWLIAASGADSAAWHWGALHTASFTHALSNGQSKAMLAIKPVALGGDADTVQMTGGLSEDTKDVPVAATASLVMSTANWDDSIALNAPGNESNAMSSHYDDLAEGWGKRAYVPLAYTRARVDSVAETTLTLAPEAETEGDAGRIPFERVPTKMFPHTSPVDISWADYDNDGWPDMLVSYVSGALQLFHNDHGSFRDVTAESGLMQFRHRMTAASWGDYDGDGNVDLYIGYAYAPASFNRLYHNDGKGHFTEVSEAMGLTDVGETRQSSFIDFNNDGKLDLYVGFRDHANRLYRNDGDHFTEVSEALGITGFRSTVGSIWFDLDGDGKLDLIEANQNGALNAVYLNKGDHFVESAAALGMDGAPRSTELGSVGVAIADYDNDGRFDIFFANYGPSWLMHNDGNGTYTDVAPLAGVAINAHVVTAGWGDYDNDGRPDLFTDGYLSGHEHQEDFLFHNEGDHFRDVLPAMMAKHDSDHATTWVDYDLDGAIDLVMADHETAGTLSMYHNTLPPAQAHRSLEVNVVDAKGHATWPGAEVRLYKHNTKEVLGGRLVDTGSAYNSQSVIPLHFGLGGYEGPVDIEVTTMSNDGRKTTVVPNVIAADHIGKPLSIPVSH